MFLQNTYFIRSMAALSLFSAASLSSKAEETTIGLAVANLQADFFNQIKQSVDAEAKAKGVKLVVADAKGDAATQVDQMQDLMTRGVKAIIYIPAGATAAGVPVKAAKKAHIPVINVDRNAPDAPGDTFIATDSVGASLNVGEDVPVLTSQAVAGGVGAYLLVVILFAFAIGAMAKIGHGAYFAQGTDGTESQHVYFSFTSMTRSQ